MSLQEKIQFKGDKAILVITIVLSLISVFAVLSSAKSTSVFTHHLFNLSLCFIGMFVAYKINYRALSRLAIIFLFAAGVLLIATLAFGNDEHRGIRIGSMEIQTFYFIGFLVIFFISEYSVPVFN